MEKTKTIFFMLCALFLLAACASKRPVLYPNDHLEQVGTAAAQQDIDACMALASEYGVEKDTSGQIAKDTAEGAVVGGVSGAAAGAVWDDDAGKGAAAGAAAGGGVALTRGLFRASDNDPLFRSFVDRCLREKGYAPIGWR